MRLHCPGAMIHWGVNYPDKLALTVGDRSYRYGELNTASDQLAWRLRGHGVGRDDAVCVVCANSVEYVTALFAALKIGAAAVPLTFLLKPPQLVAMIADAGAKAVFLDRRYRELQRLLEALEGVVPRERVFVLPDEQPSGAPGDAPAAGVSEAALDERALCLTDVDDIEFHDRFGILYSSGTTGVPKGIVKTHYAMVSALVVWNLEMRLGFDDTLLLSTPLYYTGGLELLLSAMFVGAHTVAMARFDVEGWTQAVERHRATHAFLVPTQASRVLQHVRATPIDSASLRLIVSMSDASRADCKLALADRLDCDVIDHWGNTEGLGTLTKAHELPDKPASIGKPFMGDEIRVVDDDLVPVPDGEVGQLVGKSDSAFSGYHNRDDLTAQVMVDGWVLTGDLGWRDEDGHFYFAGRSKDIIKAGGITVHPCDIEQILERHDDVREAAVFGTPDGDMGERAAAAVIPAAGAACDLEQIMAWANEQLIRPQRLIAIWEVDDFPRTPAGKVIKATLRERFASSPS